MEVRKEVLEFGLLPVSALIQKLDTLTALAEFHSILIKEASSIDGLNGFVPVVSVCRYLKLSNEVWDLLLNFLTSVADKDLIICNEDETHVNLHFVSLFLFVQIWGKQANKRADCDLQQSGKKEPSTARGPLPRVISTFSFPSYLRRHLYTILYLVKDDPPDAPPPTWCLPRSPTPGVVSPPVDRFPSTTQAPITITAKEVNKLEFLIRPAPKSALPNVSGAISSPRSRPLDNPIRTIASCLRCFRTSRDVTLEVGCVEVAAGLKYLIRDTEPDTDTTIRASRISGMTKGTLVRGEDSFPDNQLIVRECQDSCIYALAPLSRAKVTACSECIIVLGPTSGCVIVENCTRIRLVYACKSTFITACHESVLHLASNRQPVLFGDNRFLQLAPFNIEYDHLAAHLESVSLPVTPNLWDKPQLLSISKSSNADGSFGCLETSGSLEASYSNLEELDSVDSDFQEISESLIKLSTEQKRPYEDLLLPADQLLPFTVPFKGGPGPLAGGAPTNSQISWVNRLGSGLGSGPPFALSNEYKEGLTSRLRKVSELQESVAKAIVDLNNRRDIQLVIQSYFKDWLLKTGKIRQVYDLAKLEQQMISESRHEVPNPPSSSMSVDNNNLNS